MDISDIEGTSPKPMFNPTQRVRDVLAVDDIDGARPRIQRQLPHSNRMTNPNDPQYQLPTKEEEPVPVPKFIRNQIDYSDVQGSQPKSYKNERPARDIMRTDDIPGTQPKQSMRFVNRNHQVLDVTDINNDGIFKTKRSTNPLEPTYRFDGAELRPDFLDKPKPLYHDGRKNYSLDISDIEGTKADSATKWYRNCNKTASACENSEGKPADFFMLPSMGKQELELELEKKRLETRGEKIRTSENRHMTSHTGSGDIVQTKLRKQREENMRAKPFLNPTFG